MSEDEFWDLTPRKFAWLFDRHLETRKHLELLIGYNTAATVNSSFSPPDEPVAPARFMPSMFEPTPEPTEEQAAADLGAMFRGLMERQRSLDDVPPPKRKRRSRKK